MLVLGRVLKQELIAYGKLMHTALMGDFVNLSYFHLVIMLLVKMLVIMLAIARGKALDLEEGCASQFALD